MVDMRDTHFLSKWENGYNVLLPFICDNNKSQKHSERTLCVASCACFCFEMIDPFFLLGY